MLGTQAPGKPSCSNPAKRPHPFETSNNSTQARIPPHLPGPMKRVIHTLHSPRKRGHIANDQLWSHVQGAGAWVSSKGAEWRGCRHSGFTRELALPLTPSGGAHLQVCGSATWPSGRLLDLIQLGPTRVLVLELLPCTQPCASPRGPTSALGNDAN